jgi:hypothetical protein
MGRNNLYHCCASNSITDRGTGVPPVGRKFFYLTETGGTPVPQILNKDDVIPFHFKVDRNI